MDLNNDFDPLKETARIMQEQEQEFQYYEKLLEITVEQAVHEVWNMNSENKNYFMLRHKDYSSNPEQIEKITQGYAKRMVKAIFDGLKVLPVDPTHNVFVICILEYDKKSGMNVSDTTLDLVFTVDKRLRRGGIGAVDEYGRTEYLPDQVEYDGVDIVAINLFEDDLDMTMDLIKVDDIVKLAKELILEKLP